MPKTFVDGREVKKWFVDGRQVKKAYLDGRLIYQSEYVLDITASDHNIAIDWAWGRLPLEVRNDPTQVVRIIVRAGVQLITANPTIRGVFDFYGGWGNREIIIENYGYIIGRGGNGGSASGANAYAGGAGGRGIYNESTSLTIINNGVIAGGGGGGSGTAAKRSESSSQCSWGGGGGAPFGAGGSGSNGTYVKNGSPASFDVRGNGVYDLSANAGHGGNWGVKGDDSSRSTHTGSYWPNVGGAAGEATRGAITWAVLGDVRGARV